MSATALASFFISSPEIVTAGHTHFSYTNRNAILFARFSTATPSTLHTLFRIPHLSLKTTASTFSGFNHFSPVMEWQDCTVKMEIDVPVSVAYKCYSDREAIPRWMPFISSVSILQDKPDLSRWSLKYKAFGRDIEFSWLARNMQANISYFLCSISKAFDLIMTYFLSNIVTNSVLNFLQPIPNQKIHWRSLQGLPNR